MPLKGVKRVKDNIFNLFSKLQALVFMLFPLSLTLALKLEEVLSFTCLTLVSCISIDCCVLCCSLVSTISYVHNISSCRSKEKVSKVRKFLQKEKLSILIDYTSLFMPLRM